MPNTKKYETDEERIEARRKQQREWIRKRRQVVKRETYAESIAKMTEEQYRAFLDKRIEYTKNYRQKKSEQVS